VATTGATVTDNQMTSAICQDLARKNLAPGRSYLDSGYLSAAVVVSALTTWGIALIGPLLADTSAQARAGNGYARADFTADYDTQTVTCPQGKTSASWTPCSQHGKDAIVATFSAADCGACPARALCTTGTRRQLSLLPRDLAEAQAAGRAAEGTIPFQADYARRAGPGGAAGIRLRNAGRRALAVLAWSGDGSPIRGCTTTGGVQVPPRTLFRKTSPRCEGCPGRAAASCPGC
jgi:hypothetical protein